MLYRIIVLRVILKSVFNRVRNKNIVKLFQTHFGKLIHEKDMDTIGSVGA